jgi:hypothetical protein
VNQVFHQLCMEFLYSCTQKLYKYSLFYIYFVDIGYHICYLCSSVPGDKSFETGQEVMDRSTEYAVFGFRPVNFFTLMLLSDAPS